LSEHREITEEPLTLLTRAAAGDFDDDVQSHLKAGLRLYLETGGTLPLERCLRLPTTPKGLCKAQRDYWLRRAWESLDAPSGWSRSVSLAEEIKRFESRIWGRWREYDTPPEKNTSELSKTLFHAFRVGIDIPRTAVGIDKIVRGRN
jgi:hypothetical protein